MSTVVEGLVSTVIAVYNRPQLLQEAVASVLAQTYRPIEIIIVDDGSTDATSSVADALALESPGIVSTVRQLNGGPGSAREKGRRLVRGEYVQYLDSDDVLCPDKFAIQVKALQSNPLCDAATGKTRFQRAGSTPSDIPLKRTGEPIRSMFPSFLQSRWWSTSTPLFRRSVVERAGAWEPLWNEEDWEYDCRVASIGGRLCWCDAWVSVTRDFGNDRLCRTGSTRRGLASRARAHELIYRHAVSAGIGPESREMRHFARELFLLARQCGAAGLAAESESLVNLARDASLPGGRTRSQVMAYEKVARIIGWGLAGRAASWSDALRNKMNKRPLVTEH